MVRIIINGQETLVPAQEYKTFGNLYDAFAPKNMVLKKLVVNSIDVPPQKVSELREALLEENTTVSMEFVTPSEFVAEILPGVIENLNMMTNLIPELTQAIRARKPEAFENLKNLSESIAALENLKQNVLKIAPLQQPDFSDVVLRLKKVVEAMESGDHGKLADVIAENLPVVLKTYAELFERVLRKLEGDKK
ncbi:hypothetical protein [Pseudothermotoga thermarum]|uniref:Uncharacterized protein n=1 Tax=Pseudothermotoga thermarum DSM 5069 TaxID=688269 RepID=F7YWM6_9THEM|nr:hypothetical protein [Pseudothermotoga thermarum]AEH52011.1 hypothetical protein Theth_1971 [Pseudothermotoga thermarum DSM 5069]